MITSVQKLLDPTAFKTGLLCIIICCLTWFSFGDKKPHFFDGVDARIVDAMFMLRGIENSTGSVVIVNIDEKSLKEHGQWPWPRDLVAKLTDRIFAAQPLVVGFDVMFAEKDRTSPILLFEKYKDFITFHGSGESHTLSSLMSQDFDHDLLLAKSIAAGKSVQGYMFLFREDFLKGPSENPPFPSIDITLDRDDVGFNELKLINAYRPILNIPEVSTGMSEGFLNVFPDQSGIIRKVPLFILMDDLPYPSLSFEMYRLAKDIREARIHLSSITEGHYRSLLGVSLDDSFFRTDDYGQLTVNFRGPFHTFLYISASDVLQGTESEFLKGKYVLIGSSAAGIMDLVATPFSSRMPGVEVHANVLDNLIKNDPMVWEKYTEIGITYTVIIIGGIIISGALVYLGPLSGLLISLTVLFGVAVGNYYLLFLNNRLVGPSFVFASLLAVFITVTFFNYFFEGRRRIFIRRAFSHYVAPSIVNELLKDPEKLGLQVNTREVTVLFCDIRRFTNLAEHSSPIELSKFLNSYFSLMTEIIIKNKGMVDKYIGDAVMAVWGSPLHDPQHAARGVRAACEMVEAVRLYSNELQLGGKSINIGVGINSGIVSAGNFGCEKHFDYTVLGDNVNLASRVEELTKTYPVQILITEYTREMLPDELLCRFIDKVAVKGRDKPVNLFEPVAPHKSLQYYEDESHTYNRAMKYYSEGKFVQAQNLFNTLYKETNDELYGFYSRRCSKPADKPPLPE